MKKKATANLRKLAKTTKYAKRTKRGAYKPVESKKEATHEIKESANDSVIATPVKRGKKSFVDPETGAIRRRPKPPPPGTRYGPPRIIQEEIDFTPPGRRFKKPIPEKATHLMYSTSRTSIIAPIKFVDEFRDFRGDLRFGKLRHNEDFVSLMPGEEGQVTIWKDGRTCFATGTMPGTGKSAQSAAPPSDAPANDAKPQTSPLGRKPARPSKPALPDQAGVFQNGVKKPQKIGGKTTRVWEICDELRIKLKRVPTKKEVLAISVDKEGASPGMTGTQWSYWVRFYGLK